MNSEDFKCNTCGDYVGEDGVWGLCDPCFDKEGGNEQLGTSLTIHNNSEFDRTDVEVKRTVRQHFLKHPTEDVSVPDDILPPPPAVIGVKDLDDLISSWEGHGVCRWKDTWEKSSQPKEATNVMEVFRAAARKDGGTK